uniref:Uncharacterized protein n=1 Tax=Hanusia phi TaxID=3032 RepID=A0A7S0HVA4_9CRYP|mmetsp:Transcript_3531/g.8637  ORF Transcript_3531/g.8637 Transcript_3531/m.8637 type:complete len:174 (+) Transcript_3531:107-628(+)
MPLFETPEDFLKALKEDKFEDAVAWNLANMESLFPQIAEVLAKNTRMKHLTIHNCGMTDEDAKLFADSLLQNHTLRTFDYSNNKMSLEGLKTIGDAWNSRLERGREILVSGGKMSTMHYNRSVQSQYAQELEKQTGIQVEDRMSLADTKQTLLSKTPIVRRRSSIKYIKIEAQ